MRFSSNGLPERGSRDRGREDGAAPLTGVGWANLWISSKASSAAPAHPQGTMKAQGAEGTTMDRYSSLAPVKQLVDTSPAAQISGPVLSNGTEQRARSATTRPRFSSNFTPSHESPSVHSASARHSQGKPACSTGCTAAETTDSGNEPLARIQTLQGCDAAASGPRCEVASGP